MTREATLQDVISRQDGHEREDTQRFAAMSAQISAESASVKESVAKIAAELLLAISGDPKNEGLREQIRNLRREVPVTLASDLKTLEKDMAATSKRLDDLNKERVFKQRLLVTTLAGMMGTLFFMFLKLMALHPKAITP